MLSIIASCFGGCYPLVVVASVEVFVVSQLALASTRMYSNILTVSRASGRVSLFASNPQFLIGGDALHITRGCVVVVLPSSTPSVSVDWHALVGMVCTHYTCYIGSKMIRPGPRLAPASIWTARPPKRMIRNWWRTTQRFSAY